MFGLAMPAFEPQAVQNPNLKEVTDSFKVVSHKVAQITLEAPTRNELTTPEVRHLAIEYARKHNFNPSGICNFPTPYPVNAEGQTTNRLLAGQEPIAAWRVEIHVSAM